MYFLEIRNRFLFVVVTFLSSVAVIYSYKETLLFLLIKPCQISLGLLYFIFTDITEIFLVYVNLIYFFSFQLCLFVFILQLLIFLIPALSKKEYNFCTVLLKITLIVWFFSVNIFNHFVMPMTWSFFFSFQDIITSTFIQLHFEAKLNEYLAFYTSLYGIFVFYCQIFTFLFFILSFFDDNVAIIKKFRKLHYYSFIIFSTIITPPDVISQVSISLGLIVLYEIFIFSFLIKNELIR